MRLASLILVALAAHGQETSRAYGWSLAALGASQAIDIHSSIGMYELNPVVGRGSCCTAGQIATKVSIVAGVQVISWWATRKHPAARRVLSKVNFGSAGVTAAIATHNYQLR